MTILATQGWERTATPSFGYASLEEICDWFAIPLEKAGIDSSAVQEEWDDMVEYSKRYLNLIQDDYKVIWWKLFNSVDAKRWCNVLGVVELLFTFSLSNDHLERVFSQLKLIKNDYRTRLSENRLDQIVRINVDGPPIQDWDSSNALDIWYKEKTRRITANTRASTSKRHSEDEVYQEVDETFSLDEWKQWLQISMDED